MREPHPHEPVLGLINRTFGTLLGDARDGAGALLRPPAVMAGEERTSPVNDQAWRTLLAADRRWEELRAAAADLATTVAHVWADSEQSPAERQAAVRAAVTGARTRVVGALDEIDRSLRTLQSDLRPLARPARPTPVTAQQEAALANVRADLLMVLAGFEGSALIAEVLEQLRRYLAAGTDGALGAWLLAGSDWLEQYLRSRGASDWLELLEQQLADVVAPYLGPDAKLARSLLAHFEGGRGLHAAVTSMRYVLTSTLDELESSRPAF
jgi:hypothetical protein